MHESIGLKSTSLGYDLIPWSECVNLYGQTWLLVKTMGMF